MTCLSHFQNGGVDLGFLSKLRITILKSPVKQCQMPKTSNDIHTVTYTLKISSQIENGSGTVSFKLSQMIAFQSIAIHIKNKVKSHGGKGHGSVLIHGF